MQELSLDCQDKAQLPNSWAGGDLHLAQGSAVQLGRLAPLLAASAQVTHGAEAGPRSLAHSGLEGGWGSSTCDLGP